jgi:chitosanase
MNELQTKTTRAIVNIFETGRVRPRYSAIAVLKGDNGHLSYGKSQVSLGSGNLYTLIADYCAQPGALFAEALRPFLPDFKSRDTALDTNDTVKKLLKDAGDNDPVMGATQDRYFDANFLDPACGAARRLGILDPLGQAVVYDSFIQGNWGGCLKATGAVPAGGNARDWVRKYVAVRRAWLSGAKPPLPNTVYRMDSFNHLIEEGKWDLALPLSVHGVEIDGAALEGAAPAQPGSTRTLRLTHPYLRGDDVKAVQNALLGGHYPASVDGVFGPFTDRLVREWQKDHALEETGIVDQKTRESLGI